MKRLFLVVPPERLSPEGRHRLQELLEKGINEDTGIDAKFVLFEPDFKLIEITQTGCDVIIP